MSAAPEKAAMPPNVALTGDYILRLNALDPTTGAQVAGVTVSDVTIQVVNLTGGPASDLAVMPFLVPQAGP